MANNCCGILKVVSKKKETLDRIKDILNYDDSEYCLYKCRWGEPRGEAFKDGDFWVQDFNISGAWSCDEFFHYGDNEDKKLVIGYELDENGKEDCTRPKYGTAHFTNLCHLAKVLDFGCELFASEFGMGFCSHHLVNCNGELIWDESGDYSVKYPETEDGEYDYDAEPIEEFGIEDFMEFSFADEIYGE